MANRLLKLASVTYIPGTPAEPGSRGYWVSADSPLAKSRGGGFSLSGKPGTQVSASGQTSVIDGAYQAALKIYNQTYGSYSADIRSANAQVRASAGAALSNIVSALMGTGPTAGGGLQTNAVSGIGQVYIEGEPGKPGKPAQVSRNSQNGWNGGGRSIRRIRQDGQVKFQFGPRSIGALVGLSGPADSQNFGEASHAFYLFDGALSIVERGAIVAAVPGIDLAARPVFIITRIGGVVTYTVGAYSYTSAKLSSGDVYLDALLYTADDYVENPVLNELQSGRAVGVLELQGSIDPRPRASGELTLEGRAVGRSNGVALAAAGGQLRLECSARGTTLNVGRALGDFTLEGEVLAPESRSIVRVPLPRMISSELEYARSTVRYSGYRMESAGGAPEIAIASSVAILPPTRVHSVGITGGIGNSQAVHRAGSAYSIDAELTADGGWGRSTAIKGGRYLTFSGADPYGPQEFVVNEALLLIDEHDIGNWQNLDVDEWLELEVEADFVVTVEAEVSELLILSDSASVLYDIELAITEALYLSDSSTTRADGGLQVAVNMATSASSFYRGFDYLAIHSLDSVAYGVKPDGIYRLGVGLGGPMDAEIDFGGTDFGNITTSRLEAVFIGCAADGEVYIKLTPDDGAEKTYRVAQRQPIMRANPAKGIAGRKWRLRLQLVEVLAAEVDMVQFVAAPSARRHVS